ncbi:MAG TPA: hypothetical protein VEZ14_11090 [Dehalococcoidia bacterium]|nr:hypothetical protein [Dehalococcoidia bacterium]
MEAEIGPELSQEGDGEPRASGGGWRAALFAAMPHATLPKLSFRRGARERAEPGRGTVAESGKSLGDLPERTTVGGGPGARRRFRPSPLATGVCVLAVAVAVMATVTYYGAQQFSRRAADTRASNEAKSFAQHSGTLATGDAFDGYIEMLRFADDPVVNAKASRPDARVSALRQMLYLNINKFSSLSVADRSGLVLASTDPTLTSVAQSATFAQTRANLSPANSDVVLAQPGKPGYIEYTAPLKDRDGTVWGVLVGRADPARIWRSTLGARVDGSRNVIINSDGLFAAGVPDSLLGQPWRGAAVGNGGVAATVAGVASICGLAPIGRDTQIDRGLNVASCLPTSVIQAEGGQAMGKQGLITLAAAVLALVLGGGFLVVFGRGPAATAAATGGATGETPELRDADAGATREAAPAAVAGVAAVEAIPEAAETALDATDGTSETIGRAGAQPAEASAAPEATAVAFEAGPMTVDVLALIEAYEQRNARLSERLRETVQARLLVAAAQVDEAYRLAKAANAGQETDEEEGGQAAAADLLHARVMEELERLREQELRSIGQELHPALIRLGLPGALRSLAKELSEAITVTLEVDPSADSVGRSAGRAAIPAGQRLALYRFASESVRALTAAGADEGSLSLQREGTRLALRVSGVVDGDEIDPAAFAASALAAEAYGGAVTVSRDGGVATLAMELPAAEAEALPEVDLAAFEAALTAEEVAETSSENPVTDADPDGDAADGPEHRASVVRVFALPAETTDGQDDAAEDDADPGPRDSGEEGATSLTATLEALRDGARDGFAIELSVDLGAGADALDGPQRKTAVALVRVTADLLEAAGARRCGISAGRGVDGLLINIEGETGGAAFDGAALEPLSAAFEALGGYVSVSRRGSAVRVTAELPLAAAGDGSQDAA